jgi:hypothetical protein
VNAEVKKLVELKDVLGFDSKITAKISETIPEQKLILFLRFERRQMLKAIRGADGPEDKLDTIQRQTFEEIKLLTPKQVEATLEEMARFIRVTSRYTDNYIHYRARASEADLYSAKAHADNFCKCPQCRHGEGELAHFRHEYDSWWDMVNALDRIDLPTPIPQSRAMVIPQVKRIDDDINSVEGF